MYIEPSTNIRLLKDVPLDTTYNHTLYFSNLQSQANYFMSKQKHNLANYSYQRKGRGVARVGIVADRLYDCNYMMFQNSAFSNKWFYAFITSVEYVNNETSEVSFEIDVIQTWLFDFTLRESFVEREHSASDKVGEHILPEPVSLGEYVFDDYSVVSQVLSPMCVIVAVSDTGESATTGNIYDGVYSGVVYHAFNISDVDSINALVQRYAQSPDSIVSMYMSPVISTGGVIDDGGITIEYAKSGWSTEIELDSISDISPDFDGYVPKNNKLYTYPYYFLHLDNASGQSLELRYEFFSGNKPRLQIDSTISAPVKVTCRPNYYKGIGNNTLHTEVITLENYPQCSWNIDAYKVWLSQNIVPMFMKSASSISQVVGGAGTALAGAYTGNLGTALQGVQQTAQGSANLQNQVSQYMLDAYTASIQADICKGNINNGNINISHGYQNFYKAQAHIKGEYAKAIDDFFTVFGYATKRVKVPNTHSRPHWNYVKTNGCVVTGSVPSDDMRKICAIHDNGITYWKNGNEVGNYSLDNSPA